MIGIWQQGDEFTFTDKDGKEVAHQTGATPGAAKLEDVDGNGVIDSKDREGDRQQTAELHDVDGQPFLPTRTSISRSCSTASSASG